MFCFGYWYHVELAPASLTFSQIFRFVRRSPVASCLGSSLPGRKLSRLTPTNVGTPCAFLTGPSEMRVRGVRGFDAPTVAAGSGHAELFCFICSGGAICEFMRGTVLGL